MLSISRRGGTTEGPRRSRGALALSLGVNAVVIVLFFRAVSEGHQWSDLWQLGASREVPAERIGFVQLPKATGAPVVGRSGGDARPVSAKPRKATPAAAAPTTVPG